MAHIQRRLTHSGVEGEKVKFAKTAEKAGLGPKTTGHEQKSIKAGRLKGQLFACRCSLGSLYLYPLMDVDTVTNQVIGALTENVLPFVLRFVDDWRAGKTTIKGAVKGNPGDKVPPKTEPEIEKQFLRKVERELALPDYNLFSKLPLSLKMGTPLTNS